MARTTPLSDAPADPSAPPRSRRRPDSARAARRLLRSVWLWPVLATLACGLYRIATPVLWHDELATLSVVRRPAGAIWDMLQNVDAVHGTYYLLLHYWISVFGDSPAMLRLPTVLAMAGAAGCTALAGRRMFGERAGLAAGLVFALVPTVTRYAQEARSYAFVMLVAAGALLLLLRALERPGVVRWLCYAGAVAAAAYLHLVSLVFLGAHAVGVLLAWWRSRRDWRIPAGFALAALVGVAAAYPLVKLGEQQAGRQIGWITRPHLAELSTIWLQIFGGTLVTGAILLAAALAWGSDRRQSALFGSVLAVLPVAAIWVISQKASVSYFMPKYLFFVVPGWAVMAGAGLAVVRLRGMVVGLLALAVLAAPDLRAMHRPLSHADYTYPEPVTWFTPLDYRAAADLVAAGYRPGDAAAYGQQQWALWWGVDAGVQYYLPKNVRLRDVFLGLTGEQRADLWPSLTGDPVASLGPTPPPRIWLVSKDDGGDPFTTLPPGYAKVLQDRYKLEKAEQVSGISVALLVRR
ncbi:glycosyltransferase family 39 protein [Kitasatospora cinereorecta]|uniref:Glycosyltransferase family 39 protein n=1 Tax=Kitasatospora cinereorecta TaxID=285560 RepID=A0ABW0VRD9_9ACTN